MTGGRRMDAALERCVEELGKYLTATGRVRADGPLKRLQDDVAALAARRDELAGTAERLRKDLERRQQVRRELEDLDAPEAEEERRARLRDAREHLETARGHAEKLRRTREVGERAEKDVEQAQERLEGLLKLRAELGQAARDLEKARERSSRAGEDLSRADAVKAEAENSHAAARAAAEATADALRRATRAEAGATAAARRAELAEILRSAEAYRSQMEEAAADARRGITASVLEKLETLDREFRAAKRALEAGASWVSVTYEDGRLGAVSLDGAALAGGERVSVTKPLVLVLEGIGRLTVNPGAGADASTVESAGEAFGAALAAAHVDTLEAARASARTRRIAEQKMRLRRQPEARLRAGGHDHRFRPAEPHHVGVAHPVGRGHDRLVAGLERRQKRVPDHVFATRAHGDLVGCIGEPVVADELLRHGGLQLGGAIDGGIARFAPLHRRHGGGADMGGRVEIGLAGGKGDDVRASGPQRRRARRHRDRRRRAEPLQCRGQKRHGRLRNAAILGFSQ